MDLRPLGRWEWPGGGREEEGVTGTPSTGKTRLPDNYVEPRKERKSHPVLPAKQFTFVPPAISLVLANCHERPVQYELQGGRQVSAHTVFTLLPLNQGWLLLLLLLRCRSTCSRQQHRSTMGPPSLQGWADHHLLQAESWAPATSRSASMCSAMLSNLPQNLANGCSISPMAYLVMAGLPRAQEEEMYAIRHCSS